MIDGQPPCWIPERIVGDGGAARCRWVDAAGLRFTDPFFETALARRRRDHGTELSTLEQIHERAAAAPAVPPLVFIFHVSRCGSTLFSQLFGIDERTLVLSEAPVLDQLLTVERPDREPLFAAALQLLGRPRFGEQRVVVKTDCWHLFHLPALRRLYPRAPFILLYRAPAGVLASHRAMRGMHMVPGLLKHSPIRVEFDAERGSLDSHAAVVLEHYYRAMLDAAAGDRHCLLVSYEEGFPTAFLRAARWLGLWFDDHQRQRLDDRCGYHAKRPHEAFNRALPSRIEGVDLSAAEALFNRLEQERQAVSRRAPA